MISVPVNTERFKTQPRSKLIAAPRMMSGCEAIARGAWEAGAMALVSYPGSPVTGVVDSACKYPEIKTSWAANEKVALEICAGLSYSGLSVFAVMKHVGVNVAADALFNLAYTGVRGGLVVIVGDDPGATCSQNEQDTRLVGVAANVPVLEPSDVNEALLFTKLAFAISRRFDLPVIVRVTTQLCYGVQGVVTSARETAMAANGFAGPAEKFLLLPSHVPARHRALIGAIERLQEGDWSSFFFQEHWPEKHAERYDLGFICAGHTYAQVREQFDGHYPILQVGCAFPLNEARVRQFAERCERLIVTEECSTYLQDRVRSLGFEVISLGSDAVVGEFRVMRLRKANVPSLNKLLEKIDPSVRAFPIPVKHLRQDDEDELPAPPARPPGFCAGCSHVGAFDVLHRLNRYVVGDIGCYTLGGTKPFVALHANLCMGASVGVLQGYLMAAPERRRDTIAVIGDSTFFHSGIPSVVTAVNNGHAGTLLVLDNSGSAMTGFQRTGPNLDAESWEKLLAGLGVEHFAVVNALDVEAIEKHIAAFDLVEKFAVLVLKGMCVQGRKHKGPTSFRYTVTESACTNCGKCVERTDCPALTPAVTRKGRDVMSISNACIGCGMCSQTCPENAIIPRTVKTSVPVIDRALGRIEWHRVIHFVQNTKGLSKLAASFEREMN
jgi:indolepyruvate ferredoxin oxidoreductase, alpha subunit